jgi:hypothetical protein
MYQNNLNDGTLITITIMFLITFFFCSYSYFIWFYLLQKKIFKKIRALSINIKTIYRFKINKTFITI